MKYNSFKTPMVKINFLMMSLMSNILKTKLWTIKPFLDNKLQFIEIATNKNNHNNEQY